MFRNTPRLRQAVTPIALAIVSLFAALALWVAVTDAEHPTMDREFGAALRIQAINVGEGLAVRSITPDAVRVTVRATEDDFERLTAASFRATVDMTGIREGESERLVSVEVIGVNDVDILDVQSSFATVTLENAASKTVPVRVNRLGSPSAGFYVADEETTPSEVTVSGAASLIALVESAGVDINMTGVRANIQQQYTLTARDATGADVRRIRITPSTADVRVVVQQQESNVVLPVVPRLSGSAAAGHRITSVQVDPSTVVINGPIEQLQGMTSIDTAMVEIGDEKGTVTRNVRLQLPDGLESSRPEVSVTVNIVPAVGDRVLTVAPLIEQVPEGLNATMLTTSVNVRVRGEMPLLNELNSASIRAVVDASGLQAGEHTVPISVELPGALNNNAVEVIAVEPGRAVIALRQ